MTDTLFTEKIQAYAQEVEQLPDVDDAAVQQAAVRLERMHFSPTLILPADRFVSLSKTDILQEIERVAALTDQEMKEQGIDDSQNMMEIKLEDIGLLVYHFRLLTRLRQDDPNAWDEIDELYGDD